MNALTVSSDIKCNCHDVSLLAARAKINRRQVRQLGSVSCCCYFVLQRCLTSFFARMLVRKVFCRASEPSIAQKKQRHTHSRSTLLVVFSRLLLLLLLLLFLPLRRNREAPRYARTLRPTAKVWWSVGSLQPEARQKVDRRSDVNYCY